ncbi:MAG: hypothetical protein NTV80_15980 [Verrucomicrobia bacterium]|nr:hypothetical protein [Verrucomicrobiota bacterium]
MKKKKNNPISILIIALCFVMIGVALLFSRGELLVSGGLLVPPGKGGSGIHTLANEDTAHLIGMAGIAIGICGAAFYFSLKRDIDRGK